MSPQRKKLLMWSLGIALAGFAVLGFGSPGLLGLPHAANEEKATVLTVPKEGVCQCANRGRGACCSGESNPCCRAQETDRSGSGDFLVMAQDGTDKAQQPKEKEKMMMASPEAMAKGVAARKAVVEHRKAVSAEMVYSCCIKPGCAFCSLSVDMCPCAMNLRKGGPVCPECWGGWQVGHGRLDGIDAEKVQVIPKSKLKMMYDMRAKNFQKASAGAGTK